MKKGTKKNKQKQEKRDKIIKNIVDVIFLSGLNLFSFIFLTILVSTILFFFKIGIGYYNLIIAIIGTIAITYTISKKKQLIHNTIAIFLAIAVLLFSMYICSHTYDITYDGNTYHKLAIGLLRDGYNPVYEKDTEFIQSGKASVNHQVGGSPWVQHYPKASWIFSSNLYKVTNNIETSKVFVMLLIYITFCFSLSFFYKKTNIFFSFIISFLLAINPVSTTQAFSNYVDGAMGLLIYIIIISLINLSAYIEKEEDKKDTKKNWLILAMAIIICINLKFTGLVYAGMFCISFFLLWLYRAYKNGCLMKKMRNYLIYYLIVVGTSIFVVGYSSYITNTISHHNPLYPLVGKDKVDIMTNNSPVTFPERNPIDKFFTSMYAIPANYKSNSSKETPKLRIPFKTNKEEIQLFNCPDLRISGFGVFFSGIFTISVIVIICYLVKFYIKKEFTKGNYILAFLIVSLILAIITDGSWWARYSPYVYLLPILASYLLVLDKKIFKNLLCTALIILLAINNYFILKVTVDTYIDYYKAINPSMIKMKKISDKKGSVDVAFREPTFTSQLYNMQDKNINFKIHKDVSVLKNPKYVNYFFYGE